MLYELLKLLFLVGITNSCWFLSESVSETSVFDSKMNFEYYFFWKVRILYSYKMFRYINIANILAIQNQLVVFFILSKKSEQDTEYVLWSMDRHQRSTSFKNEVYNFALTTMEDCLRKIRTEFEELNPQ